MLTRSKDRAKVADEMAKKTTVVSDEELKRLWAQRSSRIRTEKIKSGELKIKPGGAAIPKPTVCPRCGKMQPSARIAWMHCRTPQAGRRRKRAQKE